MSTAKLRFLVVTGLLTATIAACFPAGNVPKTMPLLATWGDSGDLEIAFPVCEGEAIVNVAALAGDAQDKSWTVRQGDPERPAMESQIFDFTITSKLLSEGLLTDQLPVIKPFEPGHPIGIGEFNIISALTTNHGAGMYLADIGASGSWLIDGDPIDHDSSPRKTSRASGMAQVANFCESESS